MIAVTIMRHIKRSNAKELLDDLGLLIIVAFPTELLKIFGKVMVVGDWMTSLVR